MGTNTKAPATSSPDAQSVPSQDARGSRFIPNLWQDVRFGARMLRKNPGFRAVIVLTLALGIGANATMFTIVKAVLLGSLPVNKPDQIVALWSTNLSKKQDRIGMSFPDMADFQTQAKSFRGLSFFTFYPMTISDPGLPAEQQWGARVSGNTFSILGVQPIIGRDFRPEDDIPGAPPVVILGYDLWHSRYAGDPNIVGKPIRINEDPKTIVGVMPKGVEFPYNENLWFPIRLNQAFRNNRDMRGYPVFGRLADSVSIAQAQSEVKMIADRLQKQYPDKDKGIGAFIEPYNNAFNAPTTRLLLWALFGAVAFVLLIACANVANLLLSRSLTRAREISIRAALGAGRGQVVRQLLTESFLLALLGSAAGLLFAYWGVHLFVRATPPDFVIPYWWKFSVDYRVYVYLAAICVVTTLLCGLVPALHSTKLDLSQMLKEGVRGSGGRQRRLLAACLVVCEMALALVLLTGAGLMIRSFVKESEMSTGLESKNVLSLNINLFGPKYNNPANADPVTQFYDKLQTQMPTVQGAEAVAAASSLPMSWANDWTVELEDQPLLDPKQAPTISGVVVSEQYFHVMGIPLLRGRVFNDHDGLPGQTAAIINQRFAKRYWPNGDTLGKRIRLTMATESSLPVSRQFDHHDWLTVVGIAPDIQQQHPSYRPELGPLVYIPYREAIPQNGMMLIARSHTSDGQSLATPLRAMVARVNPDITVTQVQTLAEYFSKARYESRTFGSLFVIFALIGLLLASVGIYAVMAHSVSQRTREIGIRMTFGAPQRSILSMIVKQGVKLAAIGVLIGVGGAFAITRVMATLLIGVKATDPTTFVIVALLLTAIATLACFVPARRAARVDPMLAIRTE